MQHWTRAITVGFATIAVVLAACGTTSTNRGGGASEGAPGNCRGSNAQYVIGMSQANLAEPYRQRMNDDIQTAAAKVPQFSLRFADAAQDNSKQVADVENFLTQRIDLLIISPNEAKPLTAVVERATGQGIPVLALDHKVEGRAYTSFIGADNVDIGRRAGQYVARTLLPQGGTVAELTGLPGSTPAQERGQGFREGIKDSSVRIVATQAADWLRDSAQAKMDAILHTHQDLDVLFAHGDPMAEGAYLAARTAGRANSIKFIGIDALPTPSGGIKAVEAGRLSATFRYPTGGQEAIEAAKKLLIDCVPVPKIQTLSTELITKDNAAEVYARLNPEG